MLPYLLISLAAAVLIVVAARVLFGVAVRGPYLDLFAATLVYLIGALGFGLLVSTPRETPGHGLPGRAWSPRCCPRSSSPASSSPSARCPCRLQVITYAVPARYFNVILRGVILKGAGLTPYWRDVAFLVLYATVVVNAIAYVRLTRREV